MTLNWQTLTGPTVIVDSHRAKRNIRQQQAKADQLGLPLRPHFKTHQSPYIGEWFRQAGTQAIAVSSVAMAQQFAAAGWDDILLAMPVNVRQLPALNHLAATTRLGITVEHLEALNSLQHIQHPVDLWVEIDAGYQRSGMSWENAAAIEQVLQAARALPMVRQLGLLLHAGNTYQTTGDAGIRQVHEESLGRLGELLAELNFPRHELVVSVGDTPSCSRMTEFPGADELRPGNYVFFDLQQLLIGSCDWDDIALAVACPVIGRYPARGEVVVHGGAVHFSKDAAMIDGRPVFGQVMQQGQHSWGSPMHGARLTGLSQEHGKVQVPPGMAEQLQLGDLLVIVPAHSCLTMAAFNGNFVTTGG